jgi:hypothetical protein
MRNEKRGMRNEKRGMRNEKRGMRNEYKQQLCAFVPWCEVLLLFLCAFAPLREIFGFEKEREIFV